MLTIIKSPAFSERCPQFLGGALTATVTNSPTSVALQSEIDATIDRLLQTYDTTSIKSQAGIAATRNAYRLFGKDPSRYRPSCEQLARRALQGKGLYTISTLVDLGNLLSLASGYSVAVLDRSRITGETITLGLGDANEPYEAIGRGLLNIEHLPVYRDSIGGFATPTSDNVRTMVSETTTKVLILINAYDGDADCLSRTMALAERLLLSHAAASDINHFHY